MIAQLKDQSIVYSFHENGFAVARNLIPLDICLAIKNASLSRIQCIEGDYSPAINVHKERSIFTKTMCYRPLIDIVEQLVHGFVRGLQSEFFYQAPGTDSHTWHQDNFYVEAQPSQNLVSAWLSLENKASKKNGSLIIAPGTHKLGICPVKETNYSGQYSHQDLRPQTIESIFNHANYPTEDINLNMGDVVFMHSLLQHSCYKNKSNRYCMAYLMSYIKNGTSYRPGYREKREDFNVYF